MRKASSMLELVIAIVVMSIAVMSMPIMLSQTDNNNALAMQQEILLSVQTKMKDILTYRWDENSLIDDKIFVLITDGDTELNATDSTTPRRIGHVNAYKRRKISPDFNTSTSVVNLGSDSGDLDDIDDFNGVSSDIIVATTDATQLDYRFKDFNVTSTISYISDIADYNSTILNFTFNDINISQTSSIKMVTLNVTGVDFPFRLISYSCNVGEGEYLRKAW